MMATLQRELVETARQMSVINWLMNVLFRLLFMTSDIILESYVKPCENYYFILVLKNLEQ